MILGYFLYRKRKDVPFTAVLFLFIAFILLCGLTHLIDAAIFWWPAYKLSAVLRLGTAIISWGTVFALVKVTPKLLDFRSPAQLEEEIEKKTKELQELNQKLHDEIEKKNASQALLTELNEKLEQTVEERTESLVEANAELTQVNSLFQSVQEAAYIGVWEIDLEKDSIYWSDAVYEIYELPKGTRVSIEEGVNYYHDEHKPIIQEAVNKAINDGVGYDLQLKLITAKKNEVWVNVIGVPLLENGKTVSLRGLIQDIDNVAKSAIEVEESKKNLSTIIENTSDLIWSLDTDFKLTIFNKHFAESVKHKYGREIHIGLDLMDPAIDEHIRAYWKEKFDTVFTTRKKLTWLEYTEDVNTYSELSVSPIIQNNEIIGLSCLARDVTEFKKQELLLLEVNNSLEKMVHERTKKLEENNHKLQAVNKELESFSYSVSHDLRSPLRGIHGFTHALKEDFYDIFDETGKDYLDRVLAGTTRMGELIDDMLKLSKVSRAKVSREEIDMSGLVKEVTTMLDTQKAKIEIEAGLKAQGDVQLVKAVLQNLLENSLKYSSKIANPRITFGAKQENGTPIYYVTDNGSGFDMKYVDKLFTPFQRLHSHEEFSGNGIGLATVNRIIMKHGGKIWAESKPNEGATFYFTLN